MKKLKAIKKYIPVALVLCLGLSATLGACSRNASSMVLSTAISEIVEARDSHSEQLKEYDSPYTICYKNKGNTYSMYIFASPIQYKTASGYEIIDNTVIASEKEGFTFENKANEVKTYFPKTLANAFRVEKGLDFLEFKPDWNVEGFSESKQINYTNMYGDKVSAVTYERKDIDLVFYPTKAGIKAEVVLKEKPASEAFSFTVENGGLTFENKQNGYIVFKNGDENKSVIYQPLVQYTADKGEQLDVTAKVNIKGEEEGYRVTVVVDESILNNAKTKYPVKLDPSFEMYLNKMPDTSVYSEFGTNSYLRHYAVVGEHPVLGEGWEYLRLRMNKLMVTTEKNILKAEYFNRCFYESNPHSTLELSTVGQDWSSTKMVWDNKVIPEKDQAFLRSNSKFDITEFARNCVSDQLNSTESNGLVLQADSSYSILATSDNSVYSPYVKLQLKKKPLAFIPIDNINQ